MVFLAKIVLLNVQNVIIYPNAWFVKKITQREKMELVENVNTINMLMDKMNAKIVMQIVYLVFVLVKMNVKNALIQINL